MRLALALIAALEVVPAALSAQQMAPVLEGRVFMDFNYLETEREVARGFSAGQLAGHLVASLSDRFTFFGEVSATATDSRFNVEVERAIVRYDHADWFRISAGRYHTPIGYWNTAFHHGQWLQTTVARPQMIRFGGTLLPVHFVGMMAEGRTGHGMTSVAYALGVGNGRHLNPARAGDAGDANATRAFAAAASLSHAGRAALRLGASYYADRVTGEDELDLDERIVSIHLARERETPELIAEYARVFHEPRGGGETRESEAYYAQLAYRLPGGARAFKPYVRAERVRPDGADPLFAPAELGYEGIQAGVRYDVGPLTALKLEYRGEQFEGEPWSSSVAAQLSFTFSVRTASPEAAPPPPPAGEDHGSH